MTTLLVVDDDEDMREVLVEIFSDEGFTVETAAAVDEAITALRHSIPGLLLLDFKIGGQTATAIVDACRADVRLAGVPIVVVTGVNRLPSALDERVVAVVEKPFIIAELVGIVRAALASSAWPI